MSKGRVRAVLLLSLLGCGGVTPKPFGVGYDGGTANVEDPTGGHGEGGHGGSGGSRQTGGERAGGQGGTGGLVTTGGQAGGHAGKGGGQAGAPATGGAVGGTTASGGRATGGLATGGAATGGAATGGSATGGTATGGIATGGTATGGVATGGVATGGTATGGVATGGMATGGVGMGGSGGTGARTCKQVAADYATAIVSAQACTLTAVSSCTKVAPESLGCNACDVPVQDDTTLTALRKEWKALDCAASQVCPAVLIRCVYPVNAVGVCQSDVVSTTAAEPIAPIVPIRVRGTCVWQAGATTTTTN